MLPVFCNVNCTRSQGNVIHGLESVNNKCKHVSANQLCDSLTTIKTAMNDWRQQLEDIYGTPHQTQAKYIFILLHKYPKFAWKQG